ncbi:retrovirus-related pol polyprotein from transposon TNT 1-94 [Tanacetum coccineum]
MQGTKLSYQERECKLYNEFDKFASIKGETLQDYYIWFAQLMNDIHIIGMTMQQVQVNTRFLNGLQPDQQKGHANEVRLMQERYPDLLALVANHHHISSYPKNNSQYNTSQYQQQLSITSPQTYNSLTQSLSYQAPHHQQQYQAPISFLPSSIPQHAYQALSISQQPQAEFSQLYSGLAVPSFLPEDDLIASLNKAMAFIIQQVQGRQSLGYAGNSSKSNATASGGEGHMARQCTQPKRPKNSAWFKEKLMLAGAHDSGQVLDEEQLAFLVDLGLPVGQDTLTTMPINAAFQTDDLDAFDSNCDEAPRAQAVLMANLSSYDSDVIFETKSAHVHNNTSFDQQNAMIMSVFDAVSDQVAKCTTDNLKQKELDASLTNPFYLKKAQRIKPTLYDGSMISKKYDVISVVDEEETLMNYLQNKFSIEQCSVDKKYVDIQKKEFFLDNDRLLEHIICQDVMNIVMHADSIPVNVLSTNYKCLVNDNLESERLIQENDHLFKLLLSQYIVHICVNSLATLTNYAKIEQDYIDEYSENLVLKAELAKKLDAKDISVANLRKHIESLKGKNVGEKAAQPNNAKVIAPRMFKLDLELLSPKELVEHTRALRPLDNGLDSACNEKLVAITPLNKNKKVRFAEPATSSSNTHKQVDSHKTQDSNKPVLPSTGMKSSTSASRSPPSDNMKNNRILQTTSSYMKNRVRDHSRNVKSNSNKMNRVSEPVCNANVKHTILNTNSELICVKCNKCMFDANHDLCFLDFVNDVNVRSKSKSAKSSKKNKTWKPTSKIFTDIGYRWKPTGWTFTLAGNTCPLTRITSTKVDPLKETTLKLVTNPNPEIKIYRRKTKVAKSVDLSSEPRNRSQLINFVPKFLSTVRIGNEIAKIMGYCDNQQGNVTILRAYYVKGLGIIYHLCSTCLLGKSKKSSHKPKAEDTNQEKLYLLHMDLCEPMRVESINGKKYILVIIDDHSRFTWIIILRSKDEAPETLREYYEHVGISHPTSVACTPQQNDVVKRQNHTLVEAARTMLIFSKAPLFLWAEAVNTTCYTQNVTPPKWVAMK